jgi:hypothetical protein
MKVGKTTKQVLPALLVMGLVLAGCNIGQTAEPTIDINAQQTSIVGTTVAQFSINFTQTAAALPSPTSSPTNTSAPLPTVPLPTLPSGSAAPTTSGALPTISFNASPLPGFTPIASPVLVTTVTGVTCDSNVFEGDVTIPDGTLLKPGVNFQKIWALRNTGTCTWDDGYKLVFYAGDKAIDPYDFAFKKSSDFVSPGEGINIAINLTAPLAEGKYQGHWKMQNDQGQWFGTFLSVYIEVRK